MRRRIAGVLFPSDKTDEAVEHLMVKTVTPPSMGSYLRKIKEDGCLPAYKVETAINLGQEAMLPIVTAHLSGSLLAEVQRAQPKKLAIKSVCWVS